MCKTPPPFWTRVLCLALKGSYYENAPLSQHSNPRHHQCVQYMGLCNAKKLYLPGTTVETRLGFMSLRIPRVPITIP